MTFTVCKPQTFHDVFSYLSCVQHEGWLETSWNRNITVTSQWSSGRLKSFALDCLCNRLFKVTSQKTQKPALLALSEGNPPVTGGLPSQRVSIAENSSISWRHHDCDVFPPICFQPTMTTAMSVVSTLPRVRISQWCRVPAWPVTIWQSRCASLTVTPTTTYLLDSA